MRNISNVNIRTGNGINYKVFKTVLKDRLVLVLDEQNGWCKVEIGKGEIGYMSSAYLIAASTHHHEPTQNHIETSNKNISDSSMPNDKDITNQTINNINIKSDSVRLFFRYNGSYQQNESLNNSSPMIKQVYSNNSWHTTIYYSPSIRVTQQSLQQPQNVQRQGYSSQYINSTNNSRQVDTQQLRSNQSVNNFQNSNSSHLKVVHSPVLVRRNSPTQKYSSEYKDRNSNTRQIAPRKQQNQTINNSQSKYRTSNTGQRNVQRQQTGQPINKVRNNPTQRPNYGTNYPTSKVNSTRR